MNSGDINRECWSANRNVVFFTSSLLSLCEYFVHNSWASLAVRFPEAQNRKEISLIGTKETRVNQILVSCSGNVRQSAKSLPLVKGSPISMVAPPPTPTSARPSPPFTPPSPAPTVWVDPAPAYAQVNRDFSSTIFTFRLKLIWSYFRTLHLLFSWWGCFGAGLWSRLRRRVCRTLLELGRLQLLFLLLHW